MSGSPSTVKGATRTNGQPPSSDNIGDAKRRMQVNNAQHRGHPNESNSTNTLTHPEIVAINRLVNNEINRRRKSGGKIVSTGF